MNDLKIIFKDKVNDTFMRSKQEKILKTLLSFNYLIIFISYENVTANLKLKKFLNLKFDNSIFIYFIGNFR